jgi:hypothetical protein
MKKEPYGKKCFLIAMMPAQKCESPGFQEIGDIAFESTYFLLKKFFHTPFSVKNLANHLPSKALFFNCRPWIPSPH